MKKIIEYANGISDRIYNMMYQKLEPLIEEELTYKNEGGKKYYKKEYFELISFIRHTPIFGFNSGNYDINLSKNYGLMNYLLGDKKPENKPRADEDGFID